MYELSKQPQPVSCRCIEAAGMKFLSSLKYSKDQVALTEENTRAQRLCKRWQEERKFRITASKFGLVIKRCRNHTSLAKQLLYHPVCSAKVLALLWGQQHESDALSAYRFSLSCGLSLMNAGFFVSDCGFLGASPDAVVKDISLRTVRLVEVKCPYKGRGKHVEELYSDPTFCCSLVDGDPVLSENHDYYYQIQGQMAVSGIHTCDFVVWTPLNYIVINVKFDETFWSTKCFPRLKDFFFKSCSRK